ncbi:MAG: DUF2721 domain-containing protein, partial [Verrucomicrobiota bacterium]
MKWRSHGNVTFFGLSLGEFSGNEELVSINKEQSEKKKRDMSIDLTTPGLLFPAISLLLLAYTNRFLSLATLIRNLHASYKEKKEARLL